MNEDLVKKIRESMITCQADKVLRLIQEAIDQKLDAAMVVKDGLTAGIRVLGNRFERGEAFLPELAVAAETMKEGLKLLEPLLTETVSQEALGSVVIGTVQGDIHDIGKSIVATMLIVNGFTVHDLGTDVSPEQFTAKVRETKANIIAMSALLTTTMDKMRETIDLLKKEGLRDKIKVMIGGAPVSQRFADSIGADGYGVDFNQAVTIAKQFARKDESS
ncbi:MAG: B12-binding domain-containing protein [Promethearchaeota archaeon]